MLCEYIEVKLEAVGLCLKEHLPLVLPALMRLISPGETQDDIYAIS